MRYADHYLSDILMDRRAMSRDGADGQRPSNDVVLESDLREGRGRVLLGYGALSGETATVDGTWKSFFCARCRAESHDVFGVDGQSGV